MASIFLCHSSKDKFFVRELAGKLSAAGVRVWLDEAEINIGDSLTAKIGQAIDQMNYFAVVLSRHSVASEWVQPELQIAMHRELKERKVIVLPLLIEPVDLPPFLRDKLYADFTNPERFNATFPKLLEALGVKDSTDTSPSGRGAVPRAPEVPRTTTPVRVRRSDHCGSGLGEVIQSRPAIRPLQYVLAAASYASGGVAADLRCRAQLSQAHDVAEGVDRGDAHRRLLRPGRTREVPHAGPR